MEQQSLYRHTPFTEMQTFTATLKSFADFASLKTGV
jgi:hypothetical protein